MFGSGVGFNSVNWATSTLGAQLVDFSSELEGCEACHVLDELTSSIWLSNDESSSQWLCLSLLNLVDNNGQYRDMKQDVVIRTVGWHCWQSYSTNPRKVTIHVSHDCQKFKYWDTFYADRQRRGSQLFCCDPIRVSIYPFIVFEITESFGASQIYMNRVFLHSEEVMTSPSSSREGIVTYANKTHVMNDTIASDKKSITQNKEGFSLVFHRDDSLEKDAHVNVDEYEDYDASSNGESYDTEQLVGKLEQALGFNTAIGANDNNKNYTYSIDNYQPGATIDRKDADEQVMSARIAALETIVSSLAQTCQSIDDLIVTTPTVLPSITNDNVPSDSKSGTTAHNITADAKKHNPHNNFVGNDDDSDRSSIVMDHSLSKISVTSRSTSSTGGAYAMNHFISPELVSRHVGTSSIGGGSILDMYNRRSKVGYNGHNSSSRMSTDHIHGYASNSSDDSYSDTRDSLVGGISQRIIERGELYPHMHSSYNKYNNSMSDMDSNSGQQSNAGNGMSVHPDAKHINHNSSLIRPDSSDIMTYDTTQQSKDDKMVTYTTDSSRSKDRTTSLNNDATTCSLHSTHSQNYHHHQNYHDASPIAEKDGSIGNSSRIGISDEMKDHIIDATGQLDVIAVNRRIAVMEEQFSRLMDSLEQSYHGHGAPLVPADDSSHIITTNTSSTHGNEHMVLSDSKSILSSNRTNIYDFSAADNGSRQQLEYSKVSSNNLPQQTNNMSDDNKSDRCDHTARSRTEQCTMTTVEVAHEISNIHIQQMRGERHENENRILDTSITMQGREKESNLFHAMGEKTRAVSTQVSDNRSNQSSLRDANEGSDSLLLRQIMMKIESTIHNTLAKLSTTGNISDMRVRDDVLNNGFSTGGVHEESTNVKQSERYPSSNKNLHPTYVAPLPQAYNVSSNLNDSTVAAAVKDSDNSSFVSDCSVQCNNREYVLQDSSGSLTTSGDRMDMMNSRFSKSVSFLEQFALQNRIIEERINQLPRPQTSIIDRSRQSYESIDRHQLRLSSDRSYSDSMIGPESKSNTCNYIHSSSHIEPFNNRNVTTADASFLSARQALISPALQASSSLIHSLSNNLLPRIKDNYQKSEDARFHSARINADSQGISMNIGRVQCSIPSSHVLNHKQNHCGEGDQYRILTHPLTNANLFHQTQDPILSDASPTNQAPMRSGLIQTNQPPGIHYRPFPTNPVQYQSSASLSNQAISFIPTVQAPTLSNQAPTLSNQAATLSNQAPIQPSSSTLTNRTPIHYGSIPTNQGPIQPNPIPTNTEPIQLGPIWTNKFLIHSSPMMTYQAPTNPVQHQSSASLSNQTLSFIPTYQAPTVTNQAPILTNQAPLLTNQAPTLINQAPALTNQTPILTNQAPIWTNQAPILTKQAPILTYQAPILTNQAPVLTNQTPILTNQAPILNNQAPIWNNQAPILNNQAPLWTNQSQIQSISISNDNVPIHLSSVSQQVSNPSMGDDNHRNTSQSTTIQSRSSCKSDYESDDINGIIQALHDKIYLRTIKQAQYELLMDKEHLLI